MLTQYTASWCFFHALCKYCARREKWYLQTLFVVLHAFKKMTLTMTHRSFVVLLVCMDPAQSKSTMILTSSSIPSTSTLIFCTTRGCPFKYLASFFNYLQLAHVGLAISRQSSFTATVTSERSWVMKFTVATTDLYLVRSSPASSSSSPCSSCNLTHGTTDGFPETSAHTCKIFSACLGSASHQSSSLRHSTTRPKITILSGLQDLYREHP